MTDERKILTWDEFGEACHDLAGSMWNSGFRLDIIVCVARDGLLPASSIGYTLDIKGLFVLNVEFYTGIGTTLPDPRLVDPVPDNHGMVGKRVLIIDNVADSEQVLKFVHEICEQYASEIRAAILCEKPRTVPKCEYVWRRTDRWIAFPWSTLPPVNSQKNSEA